MGNDFETVLMRRALPEARSNLAERIIAAAPVKQSRAHRFGGWFEDLLASFALPKPAFALATVLVIGLLVGWVAMPERDETAENMSSYLYMNEVLSMGDWLL